jgi:hypothetical protein
LVARKYRPALVVAQLCGVHAKCQTFNAAHQERRF